MILRLLRRIPRPLAGILVATWIFGSAWALVMPAWDGPDEIQHYSYVETLVEQHALPGQSSPDKSVGAREGLVQPHDKPGPHAVSTALQEAMTASNGAGVTVGIAKPEQSEIAFERWRREAGRHSKLDGGGDFPGANYPPLYYGLTGIGYSLAGSGASAIDHLYAARLFSVLFLLLTTVGVWFLAKELAPGDPTAPVVATAAVALWPMVSFISSMVNPDALMIAAWTWSMWAMVRIIRRGMTVRNVAGLLALVGIAIATKVTSLALLPAAGFVIVLGLWRARLRLPEDRRRLITVIGAVLVVLIPVAAYFALSQVTEQPIFAQATQAVSGGFGNVREFLSYVWQYYFPRLPGQDVLRLDIPGISGDWPAYNVWLTGSWGAFAWVNLLFPRGLYPWFLAITIGVGVLAVARLTLAAWRRRADPVLRHVGIPVAICFGLVFVVLLLGLHVTEYKLRSPTLQGRYLFPVAALAGLAVALTLRWVPVRFRGPAAGATVGALVGFQILSLAYVMGQLYA